MPDSDLAWSQVIKKYRDFLSASGYTKSSVKNYISDLNHLISWFNDLYDGGSAPLHVTEANLKNYKGFIRHFYRAKPSIASRRISSLRTFLSWAKGEGLVEIEKVRTLSPVLRDPDESGIVAQFRDYLKVSGFSVPTVKNYVVDLRHLISWIEQNYEKFALSAINEHTLRSYRSHLKEKFRAKPSIAARRLSSLKKFLLWGNKNGLVTEDLLHIAKKVIEEKEPQTLSQPTPVIARPTLITESVIAPPEPKTLVATPRFQDSTATTPLSPDLSTYKIHQKVFHHIKNTRPSWYYKYHNFDWSTILHYSILAGYILTVGFFLFYTFILKPNLDFTRDDLSKQLGDVLAATSPPSVLSFQGKLTDSGDLPVTSSTDIVYKIYDDETGGSLLWTSKTWTLTPDQNGVFSVCLGNQDTSDDCLVNGVADTAFPATLFTDNSALYLEIEVEGETLSPRQRIASVSFAQNADAVDGFHASQSPGANEVIALNGSGNLVFGGAATIGTGSGNLTLDSAGTLLVQDVLDVNGGDGSDFAGSVTFNDDVDYVFGASENLSIDASTTANTTTSGVIDLNVDGTTDNNIGLNIDYRTDSNLGSYFAQKITTSEVAGSTAVIYGLKIENLDGPNPGAVIGIGIENQDTNFTVLDGVLIFGTAITDGIDASNAGIVNALNAGANFIVFDNTMRMFEDTNDDLIIEEIATGANLVEISEFLNLGILTVVGGALTSPALNDSNGFTSSGSERLCWDGSGASDIWDCSGSPGDYAEYYGSSDSSIEAGDLVVIDPERPAYEVETEISFEHLDLETKTIIEKTEIEKGSKAWVVKSSSGYQPSLIGVVSTHPNEVIGDNFEPEENPVPVSLNGRVPVKVSTENGPIAPGDPLTSSSKPGVAMKATESGPIVGKALGSYNQPGVGKIITFISVGWYVYPLENLSFEKTDINTKSLLADKIESDRVLTSELVINGFSLSTDTGGNFGLVISEGKRFIFKNSLGETVAWISNNGEGVFKNITSLVGDFQKLVFGELLVQAESQIAGEGQLKSGDSEIFIESEKITDDSLIYITSTTKTNGLILFIRDKDPEKGFVVGVEKSRPSLPGETTPSATQDIKFNWLIINQE